MIRPDFLQKGDQVVLVSPAGRVTTEDIYPALKVFEQWGLVVKIAPHVFSTHHRFAGTDQERLSDIQLALNDVNIKAIFCTRGGYGSIRIIDKLDFHSFILQPKWLVGFSDITIFHCYFNMRLKCESIHGVMPRSISNHIASKTAIESLRKALFGEPIRYQVPASPLNIFGKATGEVIGGNLATLLSLSGTAAGYTTKGKILFIEDVGEPIHNIDRMLKTLKLSGKLASLKALIVGSFTHINVEPYFGKTVEELIYDTVVDYGYPVVFNFPTGHTAENYALYIGRKATIKVVTDGCILMYR